MDSECLNQDFQQQLLEVLKASLRGFLFGKAEVLLLFWKLGGLVMFVYFFCFVHFSLFAVFQLLYSYLQFM